MLPNGPIFMEQLKHKEAIYWYSQALQQAPADTMTIQKRAYSTWIPHLQLSLLYRSYGYLKMPISII